MNIEYKIYESRHFTKGVESGPDVECLSLGNRDSRIVPERIRRSIVSSATTILPVLALLVIYCVHYFYI